jgi:deoxyribonuclease V
MDDGRLIDSVVLSRDLTADYVAGLLALREGRLLQEVVDALRWTPDVLIVNATGRDHPRKAGLALHLGAACGLPSIGVTDRPLVAATSSQPAPERGATAELKLGNELAGYAVRTRADARPVIVHAGWRTTPETARDVVLAIGGETRTPEPTRTARQLARTARAESETHSS